MQPRAVLAEAPRLVLLVVAGVALVEHPLRVVLDGDDAVTPWGRQRSAKSANTPPVVASAALVGPDGRVPAHMARQALTKTAAFQIEEGLSVHEAAV